LQSNLRLNRQGSPSITVARAAGASLFLPFVPMLSTQIFLNNMLYDISEVTIPTDNVDQDNIQKPKRLDVTYIRNFMLFFGPISSIVDFLTFFIMLQLFNGYANVPLFRTAWFIESLCTQTLVIFHKNKKITLLQEQTQQASLPHKPNRRRHCSNLSLHTFGRLFRIRRASNHVLRSPSRVCRILPRASGVPEKTVLQTIRSLSRPIRMTCEKLT
jgi:hypothetical protein